MENVWHFVLLYLGLCFLKFCCGFPIDLESADVQNGTAWTTTVTPFLAVAFLVTTIVFVMGCVCCRQNKGFQEFTDSTSSHSLSAGGGYVNNAASTTEFTIFPPVQAAATVTAPVSRLSVPGDRSSVVRFEPLPDIRLPQAHGIRPAAFNNAVSHGLSSQDWFQDPHVNFPRQQLKYLRELGRGWFGRVVEGEAVGIVSDQKTTKVVVKILHEDATTTDQMYFLHEVKPYRELRHPNILKLLGRCLETDPFLVLLEACPSGDLKSFLSQNIATAEALSQQGVTLRMCCNIASGLLHMHDNGFVHTDFAARNCLVTPDLSVKIGDYGTSIEMFKEDYYCAGEVALPIRWCAPETLYCTETTIETKEVTMSANVWSLGVVLWEICEFGKLPYAELTDDEVIIKVLGEGTYRLGLPSLPCPQRQNLYLLMKLCWRSLPERPLLLQVHSMLNHLNSNQDRYSQDGDASSLKTDEDFERRWEMFKPNTIPKTDNHITSSEATPVVQSPAHSAVDSPTRMPPSKETTVLLERGDTKPLILQPAAFESMMSSRDSGNLTVDGSSTTPLTTSPQPSLASSSGGEFFIPPLQLRHKSPSLQNLRGSIDDLSESALEGTNASTWPRREETEVDQISVNVQIKKDEAVVETVSEKEDEAAESLEPDFDSWLKGVETTNEEDAKFVRKISEAIRDLDNALALEKTSSSSSSEASPHHSPAKDMTTLLSEENFLLNSRFGRADSGVSSDDKEMLYQPDSLQDDIFLDHAKSVHTERATDSGTDTEDETWRRRIERGEFSEKVKEKSKSVADLMVLTHIECSSGSDSDPPSLTWSYERSSNGRGSFITRLRPGSFNKNSAAACSSESNIHGAVLGEEFKDTLKKLHEAQRDNSKPTKSDAISNFNIQSSNHNREENFLANDASEELIKGKCIESTAVDKADESCAVIEENTVKDKDGDSYSALAHNIEYIEENAKVEVQFQNSSSKVPDKNYKNSPVMSPSIQDENEVKSKNLVREESSTVSSVSELVDVNVPQIHVIEQSLGCVKALEPSDSNNTSEVSLCAPDNISMNDARENGLFETTSAPFVTSTPHRPRAKRDTYDPLHSPVSRLLDYSEPTPTLSTVSSLSPSRTYSETSAEHTDSTSDTSTSNILSDSFHFSPNRNVVVQATNSSSESPAILTASSEEKEAAVPLPAADSKVPAPKSECYNTETAASDMVPSVVLGPCEDYTLDYFKGLKTTYGGEQDNSSPHSKDISECEEKPQGKSEHKPLFVDYCIDSWDKHLSSAFQEHEAKVALFDDFSFKSGTDSLTEDHTETNSLKSFHTSEEDADKDLFSIREGKTVNIKDEEISLPDLSVDHEIIQEDSPDTKFEFHHDSSEVFDDVFDLLQESQNKDSMYVNEGSLKEVIDSQIEKDTNDIIFDFTEEADTCKQIMYSNNIALLETEEVETPTNVLSSETLPFIQEMLKNPGLCIPSLNFIAATPLPSGRNSPEMYTDTEINISNEVLNNSDLDDINNKQLTSTEVPEPQDRESKAGSVFSNIVFPVEITSSRVPVITSNRPEMSPAVVPEKDVSTGSEEVQNASPHVKVSVPEEKPHIEAHVVTEEILRPKVTEEIVSTDQCSSDTSEQVDRLMFVLPQIHEQTDTLKEDNYAVKEYTDILVDEPKGIELPSGIENPLNSSGVNCTKKSDLPVQVKLNDTAVINPPFDESNTISKTTSEESIIPIQKLQDTCNVSDIALHLVERQVVSSEKTDNSHEITKVNYSTSDQSEVDSGTVNMLETFHEVKGDEILEKPATKFSDVEHQVTPKGDDKLLTESPFSSDMSKHTIQNFLENEKTFAAFELASDVAGCKVKKDKFEPLELHQPVTSESHAFISDVLVSHEKQFEETLSPFINDNYQKVDGPHIKTLNSFIVDDKIEDLGFNMKHIPEPHPNELKKTEVVPEIVSNFSDISKQVDEKESLFEFEVEPLEMRHVELDSSKVPLNDIAKSSDNAEEPYYIQCSKTSLSSTDVFRLDADETETKNCLPKLITESEPNDFPEEFSDLSTKEPSQIFVSDPVLLEEPIEAKLSKPTDLSLKTDFKTNSKNSEFNFFDFEQINLKPNGQSLAVLQGKVTDNETSPHDLTHLGNKISEERDLKSLQPIERLPVLDEKEVDRVVAVIDSWKQNQFDSNGRTLMEDFLLGERLASGFTAPGLEVKTEELPETFEPPGETEDESEDFGMDVAKHSTPDDERSSDSGFRDKGSLSESCEDACDEKYNLEDIEAELEETFNKGGFTYVEKHGDDDGSEHGQEEIHRDGSTRSPDDLAYTHMEKPDTAEHSKLSSQSLSDSVDIKEHLENEGALDQIEGILSEEGIDEERLKEMLGITDGVKPSRAFLRMEHGMNDHYMSPEFFQQEDSISQTLENSKPDSLNLSDDSIESVLLIQPPVEDAESPVQKTSAETSITSEVEWKSPNETLSVSEIKEQPNEVGTLHTLTNHIRSELLVEVSPKHSPSEESADISRDCSENIDLDELIGIMKSKSSSLEAHNMAEDISESGVESESESRDLQKETLTTLTSGWYLHPPPKNGSCDSGVNYSEEDEQSNQNAEEYPSPTNSGSSKVDDSNNSENSYVSFSLDEEFVTAIRNELREKLPLSSQQGPEEDSEEDEILDPDDELSEDRTDIMIHYNAYPAPLSPIQEERESVSSITTTISDHYSPFATNQQDATKSGSDSESLSPVFMLDSKEPDPGAKYEVDAKKFEQEIREALENCSFSSSEESGSSCDKNRKAASVLFEDLEQQPTNDPQKTSEDIASNGTNVVVVRGTNQHPEDDDLLVVDTETNEATLLESPKPKSHLAFINSKKTVQENKSIDDLSATPDFFSDDEMTVGVNSDTFVIDKDRFIEPHDKASKETVKIEASSDEAYTPDSISPDHATATPSASSLHSPDTENMSDFFLTPSEKSPSASDCPNSPQVPQNSAVYNPYFLHSLAKEQDDPTYADVEEIHLTVNNEAEEIISDLENSGILNINNNTPEKEAFSDFVSPAKESSLQDIPSSRASSANDNSEVMSVEESSASSGSICKEMEENGNSLHVKQLSAVDRLEYLTSPNLDVFSMKTSESPESVDSREEDENVLNGNTFSKKSLNDTLDLLKKQKESSHIEEGEEKDWSLPNLEAALLSTKAPMPSPEEESWKQIPSMLAFSDLNEVMVRCGSTGANSCVPYGGHAEVDESDLMSTSFSVKVDSDDQECYTPDWESGSDDTNEDDNNSSSSGEFIWKPYEGLSDFPMEVIAEEEEDEEDEDDDGDDSSTGSGTEFVPSAWNSEATPNRSALRSPDKKSDQKKNVSFKKQKYHCVYEYPREMSDSDSEGFDSPTRRHWNSLVYQSTQQPQVDYSSFADWELMDSDVLPEGSGHDTDTDQDMPENSSQQQLDFYKLSSVDYDFGSGMVTDDGEFYISSSARPFQFTSGNSDILSNSSQFFPGQLYQSNDSKSVDFVTPDSGIIDITTADKFTNLESGIDSYENEVDTSPSSISRFAVSFNDQLLSRKSNSIRDIAWEDDGDSGNSGVVETSSSRPSSVPSEVSEKTSFDSVKRQESFGETSDQIKGSEISLGANVTSPSKKLPQIEKDKESESACQSPSSPLSPSGLGELRHTRDRLKLDLPTSSKAFILDPPAVGKRRAVETVKGEASLLDSGEETEDSGIESANGVATSVKSDVESTSKT